MRPRWPRNSLRATAELAQRNSEYGERIEHQAATIDVLKAMSASPGDPQPVFDLIVRQAQELCNGIVRGLFEYDGELVHLQRRIASSVASGDAVEAYAATVPDGRSTRIHTSRRAILDRRDRPYPRSWTPSLELSQAAARSMGIRSARMRFR